MMSSNADSIYDFGFVPKKKVTTYSKAGRRRPEVARPATLRHADSAPAIPTSFLRSRSRSPEAAAAPPSARAITSSKVRQLDIRKRGTGTRRQPVEEAQSQPLPELPALEPQLDESAGAKKRKLARHYSEKRRSTGPYSTPDSSPLGARSPVSLTEEDIPKSAPDATPSPASRRSTPEQDVEMENVGTSMPFSAKTARTFKNLSVSSKNRERKKQQIPIRLSVQASSKSAPVQSARAPSASTVAEPRLQPLDTQPIRKRRLIDTLAAQAEDESSSSEGETSSQRSDTAYVKPSPRFRKPSPPPPLATEIAQAQAVVRSVMPAKKTGPKFTYSQQRTMLADDDDPLLSGAGLGGLGDGSAKGALFNFGRLTKSAAVNTFAYLDDDDETSNAGAVRSIHELRQAGANSRFSDEMDDILDRVGAPSATPSSLRRGALLELAQKMKLKDFRQQFRNHSDGASLFRSLGDETDLICGYAILAIITTLLAATTSAHLVHQLRSQGLGTLVSRFLAQSADIAHLAKDRKQNVSKNGQVTLASIKSTLLELPIWAPFAPASLSPRSLALKCLDLLMRQPAHASAEDEVLSKAVTDCLFSILADGVSEPACWDFPNQQASCDFYLALYVLEGHSSSAMQSRLSSVWTKEYAPIAADVLEAALGRPADQPGDLEGLAVRISLNITNHNSEASRLFVERGLLRRLATSTCAVFGAVVGSMQADSFLSKVLESLIMMLGTMINFCVYYPPASETLEEGRNDSGSPLNRLIRIFADNHAKTAEADSMEKTQLNVALGYLSVLLGYLCLREPIRDMFVLVHPRKSTQPLLDSINEFITFHRKVAEAQAAEGNAQGSESASLARLQNLADQLTALR